MARKWEDFEEALLLVYLLAGYRSSMISLLLFQATQLPPRTRFAIGAKSTFLKQSYHGTNPLYYSDKDTWNPVAIRAWLGNLQLSENERKVSISSLDWYVTFLETDSGKLINFIIGRNYN